MGQGESRGEPRQHGITFGEAIAIFPDPDAVTLDASRAAGGEERRRIVGLIEEKLFVVVWTRRGDVTRIISARRANPEDERSHGD